MVTHGRRMDYIGLNPFEVREVLQVSTSSTPSNAKRLNPFEVREVLQAAPKVYTFGAKKSQSL